MPKLPAITAKELVRVLAKLGYVQVNQVGAHTHWKKDGSVRITVSIHSGKIIKKKTLRGIINDLKLTTEKFRKFL